jgi:hypothetical protein
MGGLNQATGRCFLANPSSPKTCFKNPPPPYQPLVITLDPIVPAHTRDLRRDRPAF